MNTFARLVYLTLIASLLSIIIPVDATPNNGNVQIKTLANRDISIFVTDPDGIASIYVYNVADQTNPEKGKLFSDCPKEYTIDLPPNPHAVHQHIVKYKDCQTPSSSETWQLPIPPVGQPQNWTNGTRINVTPTPIQTPTPHETTSPQTPTPIPGFDIVFTIIILIFVAVYRKE